MIQVGDIVRGFSSVKGWVCVRVREVFSSPNFVRTDINTEHWMIASAFDPISVLDMFRLADRDVPQFSWLVYWPLPDASNKAWFYLDHNDPKQDHLYWMPHEEWEPCRLHFNEDELELLRGQIYESISIGDLKVSASVFQYLPEVVRSIVVDSEDGK